MERQAIPFARFVVPAHALWADQWLVLAAGDFRQQHFNAMTVAWGSLGVMWQKPFAQVVVRPMRYTFEFMNTYDTFTLCAFAKTYQRALSLLGSKSGRDGDKIKEAGLTPIAATQVAAPAFMEAELIVECRKIYWQDFDPSHFLDAAIHGNYPRQDYHRIFFGEIVAITGVAAYLR